MRSAALAVVAGAILLSGCGPRMSFAEQCSRYGYQPGSSAHANCQMQMSIADDARQQRANDAMINMGTQMMMRPAQPSYGGMTTYRMPSGRVMSCTRIGDMVSCH